MDALAILVIAQTNREEKCGSHMIFTMRDIMDQTRVRPLIIFGVEKLVECGCSTILAPCKINRVRVKFKPEHGDSWYKEVFSKRL